MTRKLWTSAAITAALALLAAGAGNAAQSPFASALKCTASKVGAVGKDLAAQLKCYAKAVGKGLDVDQTCLTKVADPTTGKTAAAFAKADAAGGCPTDTTTGASCAPTLTTTCDQNLDTIADGLIGSIRHQLDDGAVIAGAVAYRGLQGPIFNGANKGIVPLLIPSPTTASKCTSKKVGAASKLAGALYKCEAKAVKKNVPTDQACIEKADASFAKAIAKAETAGPDCQTTGDAADVASFVGQAFPRILASLPRFDGCGNGLITAGESCDDGNFVDVDACPADCTIDACTPTATPRTATVHIASATADTVTIELDYPEGKVSLPGTGFDPPSIVNLTASIAFTSVDFDHALRIVASDAAPLGSDIAELDFVDCNGATPPTAADFTCTVKDAAAGGAAESTTCSVTIP